MAAPQTIINAILDALAPLGIAHIEMPATRENLARDPARAGRLIRAGQGCCAMSIAAESEE